MWKWLYTIARMHKPGFEDNADNYPWIEDRGSRIRIRGSRIRFGDHGSDSGIGDRGSRIADRGSGIADRGSGIGDRGSRIGDRGSGIGDRGSGGCEKNCCTFTLPSSLLGSSLPKHPKFPYSNPISPWSYLPLISLSLSVLFLERDKVQSTLTVVQAVGCDVGRLWESEIITAFHRAWFGHYVRYHISFQVHLTPSRVTFEGLLPIYKNDFLSCN